MLSAREEAERFLGKKNEEAWEMYKQLTDYVSEHGKENTGRVYAAVMAPLRERDFADVWGVSRSPGRLCIQRLAGKKCRVGDFRGGKSGRCECYPPADDHPSLWNKGGKPACWVSQPYGLSLQNMHDIAAFCEGYGLDVDIGTWPSWHYPDEVFSVVYYPKGHHPCPYRPTRKDQ